VQELRREQQRAPVVCLQHNIRVSAVDGSRSSIGWCARQAQETRNV
jgi:hypothetical protein